MNTEHRRDVSKRRRMSRSAGKTPEARKVQGGIPYRFQMEHGPGHSLIIDFQPPELRDNTFLLL